LVGVQNEDFGGHGVNTSMPSRNVLLLQIKSVIAWKNPFLQIQTHPYKFIHTVHNTWPCLRQFVYRMDSCSFW